MFLLQRFLGRFLAFVLRLYFESTTVRGAEDHVPRTGGVILAGNHPNMLLDPVVCAVHSGRTVDFSFFFLFLLYEALKEGYAFWAKSTLFKGLVGKILRALGAVPVQRAKDLKETGLEKIDNKGLFHDSVLCLREQRVLLLFPEGVSYTDSHIQSLKTGAARVALEYYTTFNELIPIVPVGLNYFAKDKWRSHVVVDYGEPLYLDLLIKDEREQVRDLTARMEVSLRDLTVNVDDLETLLDLRVARNIYVDGKSVSPDVQLQLTKKFAKIYEAEREGDQLLSLRKEVHDYRVNLERLSLSDFQVMIADKDKSILRRRAASELLHLILFLPVAIVSSLVLGPPILLARWWNSKTAYVEEKSQGKLLILALFVPLYYLAALFLIWLTLGFAFLIFFALLFPVMGALVITFVQSERQQLRSFGRLIWAAMLLSFSGAVVDDLIAKRRHIRASLSAFAQQYFLKHQDEESLLKSAEGLFYEPVPE